MEPFINRYEKVLYASNILYEVIFTLPNLTQKEKDLEVSKFYLFYIVKEISQYSPIFVVWNARTFTPHDQSFPHIINQLNLKEYKV